MNNLYIVYFRDTYDDYHSEHIVAIWLDEQKAIEYAIKYDLAQDETITVKKSSEGLQSWQETSIIYQRVGYDHTQVLFNSTYYVGQDKTKEQVEKTAISQASPICVNIDWDRLYLLYKEEYCDEED
jgi:hypothetical protein